MKKKKQNKSWVHEEFSDISLGDKRLDDRFLKTASLLSQRPQDTINRAIEDWDDKKGAYRLFSNEKCTAQKIFSVHQERTAERMKGHQVILSLHDTSYLNYNDHEATNGMGSIGGPNEESPAQGLITHAALALTDGGLPLGLQYLKVWARPPEGIGKREKDCSFEEKESYRWVESLRTSKNQCPPNCQMIAISDRESDIFEYFFEAKNIGIDVVVRSKHDRQIIGKDSYLSWYINKQEEVDDIVVRDNTNNRDAIVTIKFGKIKFNNPAIKKAKHLARNDIDRVETYVVEAVEQFPPEGIEPLHWRLLTSIPVGTVEDAFKIIDYYKKRWNIENFFKVYKKGCCNVEECRLQERDRLEKYLALFSIIAWRIYWMVHVNRCDPTAPATNVLTEVEIKTIICRKNRSKDARDGPIPTVREMIRLIAKMGGFNGRKRDGEPGMITLWRGWIRLQDMVEMYEIMV